MEIPLTWREDYGQALNVPLYTLSRMEKERPKDVKIITLEELSLHNSPEDCWVVVHGRVYDASNFVSRHPGGWLPIKAFAGKPDASDAFESYHPARVHTTLLPSMFVGILQNVSIAEEKSVDYSESKDESKFGETSSVNDQEFRVEAALREVRQKLIEKDAFRVTNRWYLKMYTWLIFLLTVAVMLTLSKTYWVAGAIVMGLFWQQTAFVGHDIGHNAVLGKRDSNLFWGILIGNTLMGISLGWWKQSHNVHHVVCNSVEHDPDIQHMPVFAVNEKLFNSGGFFSTYHKKRFDMDIFARALVSIQHFLFYPVMALARINLYVQSWINLIIQPHGRVPYRELEIVTLLGFFCWIGALLSVLDTPEQRIAWVALAHAVSGLLHVQICLSHFPMDAHREGDDSRAKGWYSMQMQTSMNVDTYPMLDFVHGGLQFQVEHHMFPRLPRHSLREARRMVLDALGKVGAKDRYKEMGFVSGNLYLLETMRNAATEAAKLRKGDGGFYVGPLYHGINLEG